mgnify:CR=1 FL=1
MNQIKTTTFQKRSAIHIQHKILFRKHQFNLYLTKAVFTVQMMSLQANKKMVADHLGFTVATLNTKIKNYKRINIGDLIKLKTMGFGIAELIKTFDEL